MYFCNNRVSMGPEIFQPWNKTEMSTTTRPLMLSDRWRKPKKTWKNSPKMTGIPTWNILALECYPLNHCITKIS